MALGRFSKGGKALGRAVAGLCVAWLALAGCGAIPAPEPLPPPPETAEPIVTPAQTPEAITAPSPALPATPSPTPSPAPLPDGFVYLDAAAPGIVAELRYATENNFTGAVVDGYLSSDRAILTKEAAGALARVREALERKGLGLKVFDAYRPQKAVDRFAAWAKEPDDPALKAAWYPDVEKTRLFAAGYLARRSGHSRGSTVDLTLIDLENGLELDMGTPFDFLGPPSRHGAAGLTTEQKENRGTLKTAMEAEGFVAYAREWWHYRLGDEPFPDTYFNFDVS